MGSMTSEMPSVCFEFKVLGYDRPIEWAAIVTCTGARGSRPGHSLGKWLDGAGRVPISQGEFG